MHSLVEMLRYKRPEGSDTQKAFCKRFLEPTFGKPDQFGNYIKIIGDKPNVCFTCLLYTSPSPRDGLLSRMPSSA